jgi:hypothetical protein
MAKRARKTGTARENEPRAASVFGAGAELVRSAAVVLDNELAVGITAAKAVQQRVDRERRVDAADFTDALQRFQSDAHDLVNSLDGQLSGAKLQQNLDLAKKFIAQTNDIVDLAVGVVTTSAQLANEFIHANSTKPNAGPTPKRRS